LLKKIQQIRRSGNHGFNSLELFKHRYNNFAAYTQIKIHFQSLPVDFFRRFAFILAMRTILQTNTDGKTLETPETFTGCLHKEVFRSCSEKVKP
jgi:hypothetical protein